MIFGYWCLSPNFGDALAPYLLNKFSGESVCFSDEQKSLHTKYIVSGSILNHEIKNSVLWGCGIANKHDNISSEKIVGTRGRISLARFKELYPDSQNEPVIGDSALILPKLFMPKSFEKKYKIGIIPHYIDAEIAFSINENLINNGSIKFINILCPIEEVISEIVKCECIVTSSLHGLSVAIAYGIPAVWCKFSDNILGDDTKYYDLLSIFIENPFVVHKIDYSETQIKQVFDNKDFVQSYFDRRFDVDVLYDAFPIKRKKDYLWEILICTVKDRATIFEKTYTELIRQIKELGLEDKINIRYLMDDRKMSIGHKRNLLKESCNAKYFNFFDDDDTPSKDYVKIIYSKLLLDPDVVSLTGQITFDGQNPKKFIHSLKYDSYFTKDDVYYRPPNHLNPVKTDLVRGFKYPLISHGEDTDWAMQVCRAKILKTEKEINQVYYFYNYITNK